MATRNINLTDALDRFVAELVQSGAYQNASEVVRAGLRLLKAEEETRARKLAALNAAIQAGIDSGPGVEINDIDAYFEREVRPHVPDAWMDRTKDKVGYEINFNRHFYKYTPPRPLEEIDAELKQAEDEIMRLLREVTE